ncbi:MAG: chromate transporter [Clostridia bacterium]
MIFIDLFLTFFKIGLFTFGGGYAMLPLIQSEVISHNWMGMQELIDFIAVSESTPGPFAVNISTYVGTETGGFIGAVCSTLGVVLPSFIIILIVANFFEKFKKNKIIEGCMSGLKPAVIGLIASAVLSVGKTVFFADGVNAEVFKTPILYISLGTFLLMAVLAFEKIHPILIICLSAIIGIVAGYLI